MARMTSYQRRLNEIKYLEQRSDELEAIILLMAQKLCDIGVQCVPRLSGGINGDHFITDVNTGDFGEQLVKKLQHRQLMPLNLKLEGEDPDTVIDRLWECSNHGTYRDDIVKAYRAGIEACRNIVKTCHNKAEELAHPDAEAWTTECLKQLNAIDTKVKPN